MSQEQPPIRSRRALRQARDERPDTDRETGPQRPDAIQDAAKPASKPSPSAGQEDPAGAAPAGRNRRAADGPVDSVQPGPERSSQVRARDRATLRAIKELAEKEGQLAAGGPPTRRQLRLLQLAAETAPATAANTIVPGAPRTRATKVVDQPVAEGAAAPAAATPAPEASGSKAPAGMSVEQALAARELLVAQARNQVSTLEPMDATDPDAVDPAVLAEQIALAERAAVLNRRAAAKQKLAAQNAPATQAAPAVPARNDPTTADNLAMVTPLEFVQVPGVDRPVMKPPATTHVPVATNPGPRIDAPRKPGLRRGGTVKRGDARAATSRGGVLARAEAAAKAASGAAAGGAGQASPESEEDFASRPPVAANAAYGLDPLDAATAGLGRARRLRMIQAAVLLFGVLALIAGIILIVAGLGR